MKRVLVFVAASLAVTAVFAGIASLVTPTAFAQRGTPPPTQTPAPAAPAPGAPTQPSYLFPTGTGMLFFYVKPDKAPDFEAVFITKLGGLLDTTQDPAVLQLSVGWKIYKGVETAKDGAIYIFLFDPSIVGADYDPIKLLSIAFPAEVQTIYTRVMDAIIRVERMGLTKIRG